MRRSAGAEGWNRRRVVTAGLNTALAGLLLPCGAQAAAAPAQLLNVSYDVARELFAQINPAFVRRWWRACRRMW
jgi:sulfate transport system substrate-binding protein